MLISRRNPLDFSRARTRIKTSRRPNSSLTLPRQLHPRTHWHIMESHQKPNSALFQVYLRLRPPPVSNPSYPVLTTPERFLTVEVPRDSGEDAAPTHITLNPPNDNRRRAVEKFGFTRVFEEDASQLDMFQGTGVIPLVEGVLGANGGDGRDGLLATLGVTGSGKVCCSPFSRVVGTLN